MTHPIFKMASYEGFLRVSLMVGLSEIRTLARAKSAGFSHTYYILYGVLQLNKDNAARGAHGN